VGDRRWPRITDWVLTNYWELFEDQDKDQIEEQLVRLLDRGKQAELRGRRQAAPVASA
jgi:hypothetical protein